MNFIESILLGVVQGITEFLPISSSGHLLIGRNIFNISSNISGSFIEIFLHGGTLLSILFYWKKDLLIKYQELRDGDYKFTLQVIIGTLPAALVGLFLKDYVDNYFYKINNLQYLSLAYFLLSIILLSTRIKINRNISTLTYGIAFIIGLAQCFAIIPGISRSGITIAVAILIGLKNKTAVNFSFLLAIPILVFIFFGSVFGSLNLFINSEIFWQLIAGFIASFIFGYMSISFLVSLTQKNRLWYFSIYTLFLSILLGLYNGI